MLASQNNLRSGSLRLANNLVHQWQYRSDAVSQLGAQEQDRINPDGSVTQRNPGRKDNTFSTLDLRLSREFHTGKFVVEPVLEAFNLFNSRNLRRPEVTSLIFNFDGTVQSGAGDPLQVQLGVRARF